MKELLIEWTEKIIPWILSHGIKILLIAAGIIILNKISGKFIFRIIKLSVEHDRTMSELAMKKREDTLVRIFTWIVKIILITVGTLMILQEFGIPIGPILAGAGIVGLAVGFGGQYLIKDIISGFFIILENQYRIGDVVNIGGTGGLVEDISLRMTTLRDLDGTVHHIPHGEIKTVSNLSKKYARVNLNIGISYNSNLEQVIEVINTVGIELANDPYFKPLIIEPPRFLRIDDFADSAIIVKILGDTQPLKQWEVTGELRKRIKIAFDKAGIEIPFPQRVIHNSK